MEQAFHGLKFHIEARPVHTERVTYYAFTFISGAGATLATQNPLHDLHSVAVTYFSRDWSLNCQLTEHTEKAGSTSLGHNV